MPGHPDGQNYAIWRGPDFLATSGFLLSASNPLHVQGQVTNYASLIINVACNNPGGCSVVVNWATDSSLTIGLGSYGWTLPNGTRLKVILPAVGNFVTVDVTTADVAAASDPISIYPTNTPTPRSHYYDVSKSVINGNAVIPATTIVLFPMTTVCEGKGYAWIQDPNSTAKIQATVVTLNQNGTARATVMKWNTVTAFQAQEFVSDGQPLAFAIQNTDGAASHAVDFYLAVDSG